MYHHLPFAGSLPNFSIAVFYFNISAFGTRGLILGGLYRVFIKLALFFFLALFFLREFLLALLKIEVRFPQGMTP